MKVPSALWKTSKLADITAPGGSEFHRSYWVLCVMYFLLPLLNPLLVSFLRGPPVWRLGEREANFS